LPFKKPIVVGNCLASAVIARWEGRLVDDYVPKEA
jgi:hypothetical protein